MTSPGAGVSLDDLAVRKATLEGAIQWGEAEGDEPLLLHAITLSLAPLRIGGRRCALPSSRLHSLRLPVSSWRQLDGQTTSWATSCARSPPTASPIPSTTATAA